MRHGNPANTKINADGSQVVDTGYLGMKGADALRARDDTLKALRDIREQGRNGLKTPQEQEEFFSRLNRLGVAGVKIDFIDQETKEGVDQYESLLATAAKYQCVIDFHGANKPTGEKDSGGFDITVNWLPAKYNTNTTLGAEVTAEGPNQFDFALKK